MLPSNPSLQAQCLWQQGCWNRQGPQRLPLETARKCWSMPNMSGNCCGAWVFEGYFLSVRRLWPMLCSSAIQIHSLALSFPPTWARPSVRQAAPTRNIPPSHALPGSSTNPRHWRQENKEKLCRKNTIKWYKYHISFNASGDIWSASGKLFHDVPWSMIFPHCGLDVGEGFQFAGEDGAGGATQQPLPSTSPAGAVAVGGCWWEFMGITMVIISRSWDTTPMTMVL